MRRYSLLAGLLLVVMGGVLVVGLLAIRQHEPAKTTLSQTVVGAADFTIDDSNKIELTDNTLRLIDLGGGSYASDDPFVTSVNPLSYSVLDGFSETLGDGSQGSVRYQLSPDGATWYWWGGAAWTAAASGYDTANSATEIDAHIAQFDDDIGPGELYIRAYFHSDGSQPAALQQLDLDIYTQPSPVISSVSPVSGSTLGGTSVTIEGENFLAPAKTDNEWSNSGKLLPSGVRFSSAAVIGDKIYIFGGSKYFSTVDTIYSAPVSDPTTWTDTGKRLPIRAAGAQVAVIEDTVYMYAGSYILSAPVSDPTTWTDTGKRLPTGGASNYGQLAVIGDQMYMFGNYASDVIISASTSDPTTWTDTGKRLPITSTSGSGNGMVVLKDSIYLFSGSPQAILSAPVSDPTTWTDTGKQGPAVPAYGDVVVLGDMLYMIGSSNDIIYSAPVSDPTTWTDTGKRLPSVVAGGEVVIVGDKLVSIGGAKKTAYINSETDFNGIFTADITSSSAMLNAYNKPWLTNWPKHDNLTGHVDVRFDGVSADDIIFEDSQTITATAPAHSAGTVDVSVQNIDGQIATLQNSFEYLAPPTVDSLLPSSGSTAGGDTVMISGSGFRDGATVTVAGTTQAVTVVNETTLTFVSPPSVFGAFTVTVTNPDGQSAALENAFTYLAPPPEVSEVSPNVGPMSGGTLVTVTGSNFLAPPTLSGNGYNTGKNTPAVLDVPQLAVVDDALYLFGGLVNGNPVSTIYSAPVSDPTTWTNTGKTLPVPVSHSQLEVVGDKLYLFGGGSSSAILSAPVSDPTTWTNTGKTLPVNPMHSRVAVIGEKVYLFGGWNTNVILSAPVSDPTTWTNTGKTLPLALGGSHLAIVDDMVYLFGGSSNVILSAPVSDPTTWTNTGKTLPVNMTFGEMAIIGDMMYIFAGGGGSVIGAPVSDPTTWTNTGVTMPAASRGQLAIIDDKIYVFTGSGTAAIRAINIEGTQVNKYNKPHMTNWVLGGALSGGFGVTFGGVSATSVTDVTETSATVTTPAHAIGAVDVVVQNADGQTATLTNGFTYLPEGYEFATDPLVVAANEPGEMTIRAVDESGDPVVAPVAITLDLATSSESGFFARDLQEDGATRWTHTSVELPAGQSEVTFYYRDTAQGEPVITITDPAGTFVTQQQMIGPKYKLLVTGVTDPVVAGVPSSITVQAVDYAGQPQSDYTGTVSFSSTDGGAVLPANFTLTPEMLGMKTFVNGVSMRTQGEWCVSVVDIANPTISGSQCDITTTAPGTGAISSLKIITPPQSFASNGQSSAITVQAQDSDGTPISVSEDTTIYVYSTSPTGEFSSSEASGWTGTQPYEITIPEGATSANVYYRDISAGEHTITIRDDAGTGTDFGWTNDTQSVTVGVGEPVKLGVTGDNLVPAGTWQPITIHLQDAADNDVTSPNNIPIQLSSDTASTRFSTQYDGSDQAAQLDITLPAGATQVTVYVWDTTAKQIVLSATDTSPPGYNSYETGEFLLDVLAEAPSTLGFTPVAEPTRIHTSYAMTVGSYDLYGNVVVVDADTTVSLSTTSSTGVFGDSAAGPWSAARDQVIAAGNSAALFYYRDGTIGSPTVTAVADGLTTAHAALNIIAGLYDGALQFSVTPGQLEAGQSGQIEVTLLDNYGNQTAAVEAEQLLMISSSPTGEFSLDGVAWQASLHAPIAEGQTTAVVQYRDTKAGLPTITAKDDSYPEWIIRAVSYQQQVVGAAPATLSFASQPRVIAKNTVSDPVTIELQDEYGNTTTARSELSVLVEADSQTGEFSSDGETGWTNQLTKVFNEDEAQHTVYYRDATVGTHGLTASSTGLTDGQQNIQVVEGLVGQIVLQAPASAQSGEIVSVTIETQTSDGVPTAVLDDTVIALLAQGQFSLQASPWQPVTSVGLLAGQSQIALYYQYTGTGQDTMTASESPAQGWSDGLATVAVTPEAYFRLAYSAAPQTIPVTEPSSVFTVTAQDIYGNVTLVEDTSTVYLHTSGTGSFSVSQAGPWDASEVTIAAGTSSASFYYQDSILGDTIITAGDKTPLDNPDIDILNAAAQVEIVGQVAQKLSYTSAQQTIIAGYMTTEIVLELQKQDDSPAIQGSDTVLSLGDVGATGSVVYHATDDLEGAPITSVVVPRGQSQVTFYATSKIAANHTMNAWASIAGVGTILSTQQLVVEPADPAKLVFVSTEQTVHAGEESAQMRIALQDAFGNMSAADNSILIDLQSSCGSGSFSLDQSPSWQPISQAVLLAGETSIYMYYKDTAPNQTCVLTASATDLTAATQDVHITMAPAAQLEFATTAQSIVAGETSATITVSSRDVYGNTVPVDTDTTIYFSSSSASGQFSAPSGVIGAGQSTVQFTYTDTTPGTYVLTAKDQPGESDTGLQDAAQEMTVTAGIATALQFDPDTFNEAAGVTRAVVLSLRNQHGALMQTTDPVVVDVSSSDDSGVFRAVADSNSPAISQATIAVGQSSVTLYYQQATAGSATLTAQDAADELTDATATAAIYASSLAGMTFITSPQTLEKNQPSAAMTVQAVDAYGNARDFSPAPMRLYLHTSSPTGQFFADAGATIPITELHVATETSTASFYYRDTQQATATITVSDRSPLDSPDIGLTNAVQSVSVVAGVPTSLVLPADITSLERGGTRGPVAVSLHNAHGGVTVAPDEQPVYLSSSSATAEFAPSPSGPWTNTLSTVIPAGGSQVNFYYRDDVTLGSATITASDISAPAEAPDTGLINSQTYITIIPGAVEQLVFTTVPQTVTARHPSGAMTVEARNHYGISTTFTQDTNIYLRSDAHTGEFASDATGPWGLNFITAVGGSSGATFYYRDTAAGMPNITASTSPSSGGITASQQQTIELQVLSHFLVTNISDPQQQGNPSSVVVAAVDAENYVIDWYDGTVTFSASDGDAIVPASYTFDPSRDKGIHTFTNGVAFLSSGEKAVTVSGDGVSGSQTDITVLGNTAGPVTQLAFITPPAPLVMEKNTTSDIITVQLQDASGAPANAGSGGYSVRLQSPASSGSFAMSPGGPWQAALTTTVPEGLSYVNVYYRDSAAGSPVLSASDWLGGVDSSGIQNATLQAHVQSLLLQQTAITQARNMFGQFVANPVIFAHDEDGAALGRVAFSLQSREERTGAPRPADWQLQWQNPSDEIVAQRTYTNLASVSYQPADFATQAASGDFVLDTQASDVSSVELSRATSYVATSPWRVAAKTIPEVTSGAAVPVEVQVYAAGLPANPAQQHVILANTQGEVVASTQVLSQHVDTGVWQSDIYSDALVPGQQYVAAARVLAADGTILAEDTSESFTVSAPAAGATPISPDDGASTVLTPDDQAQPDTATPGQPLPNQNTYAKTPDRVESPDSFMQTVGVFLKDIFSSRATPTIIARSSFTAVLVLALVILWQTLKELRHARWMALLLEREKQTADDKDMFLQLSAHYLRTPATVIGAAAEMLATSHAQYAQKLTGITTVLRDKVEQLVAGVTADERLQAIVSPDIASSQTKVYRRLLFWVPVTVVIMFVIVGNWLAVLVGGQVFASLAVGEQVVIGGIAVAVLYVALRSRTMRRQRRQALERQVQQRAELDEAKNQFVKDTYSVLEDDVRALKELQRALPADDKVVTMLGGGVHSLENIINKFKTLTMINTTELQTRTVVTSQLIDRSLHAVDEAMQSKQITLERQDDQPATIAQDDVLLGSVVTSILENAVEYSEKSGHIEITTTKDRTIARLSVRDHGPGFSRDPEELFALFARGSDTLQFDHEGMGLDLYLDRLIMRHLGGSITADNHPGGGAHVTLAFPITAK